VLVPALGARALALPFVGILAPDVAEP
jgi:hypothetical protein